MPLIDDKVIKEKTGNVQVPLGTPVKQGENNLAMLEKITSNIKDIVTVFNNRKLLTPQGQTPPVQEGTVTENKEASKPVLWFDEDRFKQLLGNELIAGSLPKELKENTIYDLIVQTKTEDEKQKVVKFIKEFMNNFIKIK